MKKLLGFDSVQTQDDIDLFGAMSKNSVEKPSILNPFFTIEKYNGGTEQMEVSDNDDENDGHKKVDRPNLGIENVISLEMDKYHCSGVGKNFDLVLKYRKAGYFFLTNISFLGPWGCTAPLKKGVCFISKTEPDVDSYSSLFNDCDLKKFQSLKKKFNNSKMTSFFFETDKVLFQYESAFPNGVAGKYIHIKMICPHGDDVNIDLAKIGLFGYTFKPKHFKGFPKIPRKFRFTRIASDFYADKMNFLEELRKSMPSMKEINKFLSKISVNEWFLRSGQMNLLHICGYFEKLKNRFLLIKFFIEKGCKIGEHDRKNGKTALHYVCACDNASIKTVKYLVEKGESLSAITKHKEIALHYATFYCNVKNKQKLEIVKYLIKKGSDVNAKSESGMTPFHYSALQDKNSYELMKYFVREGGDFTVLTDDSNSILHFAMLNKKMSYEGAKYIIEKSLDNGIKINQKNINGVTPLHFAAKNIKIVKIIQLLIDKGADINIKDDNFESALHYACRTNNINIVKFLVKKNIDINSSNSYGQNAMHLAADMGAMRVLRFLIIVGGNYRLKDKYGVIPFDNLPNSEDYDTSMDYNLQLEKREDDIRLKVLLEEQNNEKYFQNFLKFQVYYSDIFILTDKKHEQTLNKLIPDKKDRKHFVKCLTELSAENYFHFTSSRIMSRDDEELLRILYETRCERYFPQFFVRNVHYKDLEKVVRNESLIDELIPNPIRREAFTLRVNEIFKSSAYESMYIINKNKIVLGKSIGSGSFGYVKMGKFYLSGDNRGVNTGSSYVDVAVKEVFLNKSISKKDILHEVRIMKQNDHPNILRCYGCYFVNENDEDIGYIVMELCGGGDLCKTLQNPKCKISVKQKLDILIQIARGMKYLHGKGIVHRDLKSLNCLFGENKKLKICDFGTSRSIQSVNQTFCGTPEYLPPEMMKKDLANSMSKEDSKLIDVYSYGILIHEIWTRNLPYSKIKQEGSSDPFRLISRIHTKNIRPDVEDMKKFSAPSDLIDLMEACWSEHPSERPESFSIILEYLNDLRDEMEGLQKGKRKTMSLSSSFSSGSPNSVK